MDEYDPLIQPLGAVPTGRKLESPDPRPRASFGVLLDATPERLRFACDRYRERDKAEFTFAGTDATEIATGRAFTIVTSGDPWVLADARAARVSCFCVTEARTWRRRESGRSVSRATRSGRIERGRRRSASRFRSSPTGRAR